MEYSVITRTGNSSKGGLLQLGIEVTDAANQKAVCNTSLTIGTMRGLTSLLPIVTKIPRLVFRLRSTTSASNEPSEIAVTCTA